MLIEHIFWMAAAIDGEGSILIRNRSRNSSGTPRFQVHVVLANQDMRFLEFAQKICACGNIYDGKRCRQLRIERREDAVRILRLIEPALVIKRDRANEALRIISEQEEFVPLRVGGRFIKA